MTRKLFWEDPYRTELATTVSAVDGDTVTLTETIFFALSGGQESDAGTIAGRPVLDAAWRGREIVYTMAPDHGLSPGDPVTVAIDWERRYRLIRLHFAAEIVLELVQQNYGPVDKTGAHISADKARIDFDWNGNIGAVLPVLQQKAAAIIAADSPVISAFSDEADEKRFWRIEGFGQVACGGTHPKTTGEVGALQLKRKNPGKGRERIEITLA